jgi:hypothetical protein
MKTMRDLLTEIESLKRELIQSQKHEAEVVRNENTRLALTVVDYEHGVITIELERDRLRDAMLFVVTRGYRHFGKECIRRLKQALAEKDK